MSIATVPGGGSKSKLWTTWLTMGVVAIGAVAAGLLVPQLMPGEMVIEADRPKAEAKSKTKSDYTGPALPEMPNPRAMLSRLAWGTVLVLGLSVASIWAMRRWTQTREPAVSGQRALRLVETLPLGNRCSLHLVHLGSREVLVGVDGAGIKTIVPLAKTFDEVLADTATSPAEVNS
jgi:flagellar biogenesis protein FliO